MSFYSLGKKCTYGIKCKFYHPERTNQSQRSLADELRENARLSGSKEDRRITGRGIYPRNDPGFGSSAPSLEQELEQKLKLKVESSGSRDVMLNCWDDILSMKKPLHRATVGQCGTTVDRSSLQAPFSTNPSSIFSSDSGLGSYQSQFSESSQSIDDLHRVRSSHPPLFSFPSAHADGQRYYESNMNPFSNFQPNYSAYSSLPLPDPVQSHSLPAFVDWSCPLYMQQASSLPEPLPRPSTNRSNAHRSQQHSAVPHSSPFQEEREEVRKNLHAIFNPHHVNRVMEMFPQMKDPQELAAEVLKLKSQ